MGDAERASTDLRAVIERIRPTVLSAERVLSVPEPLRPVFPLGGLSRGSRLSLRGTGAASIAMHAVASASREGWSLERSVFVVEPPASQWGTVMAALVDAVDVVIVDPAHQVTASDARRLAARSRERGAVVVDVALDDGRRRYRWPTESDLVLTVEPVDWDGLEVGHGLLGDRLVRVTSEGRRGAARPRSDNRHPPARSVLREHHPGGALAGQNERGQNERGERNAPGGRHLRSVG